MPNLLDWIARRQSKRHGTDEKMTKIHETVTRTETIVRDYQRDSGSTIMVLDRVLFPERRPRHPRVVKV